MTAHEFNELIARLSSGASRRETVRGIVGGALASAGVAAVTATSETKGKGKGKGRGKGKGKGKGKKKKRVAGEHNAVGNGKRVFCDCPDENPENCRTRRVKTKKFKKLMRRHPNSHRGPCGEATTTTSTTNTPTSTSTTNTSTSTSTTSTTSTSTTSTTTTSTTTTSTTTTSTTTTPGP